MPCETVSLFTPQSFMVSEREALLKETLTPVYVVPEDEQLLYMYEEVKQAAATRTLSIFIRGERTKQMCWCTFTFHCNKAEKEYGVSIMRFACFPFCQSFEVWSQLQPFRS